MKRCQQCEQVSKACYALNSETRKTRLRQADSTTANEETETNGGGRRKLQFDDTAASRFGRSDEIDVDIMSEASYNEYSK
jgi:hypothetical protein